MAYSFPKNNKLCGQLRIAQLYKEGQRFVAWPLRVTYMPITNHQLPITNQILVWAPKALFKKAVQRNRLRRLMREAYRLHQDILTSNSESGQTSNFLVGTTEFAIPMDQFINVEEELKKLEADLAHQQGFLKGVMAKLSNERFVQNAKPEIVELERKKKADAEQRIETLKAAIAALS